MDTKKSEALFARAKQVIPGGVNSPVRAFGSVGGTPRFITKADGPYIYDADNNRYIDYVLSWGPMILGHAHPAVCSVIEAAMKKGTSFGAPTELEVELAELIIKQMPAMEMIRFVNSGTEATMSALRLARAYTKRDKIVKFSGCYHGHADMLLVQAGSGVATLGLPDSPGVPKATTAETLVAPYNDLAAVEKFFAQFGEQIAAVIVEPTAGNMGFVAPVDGFLMGLQNLCRKSNALFVLDEVMTGFRVALGGAQGLWGLDPDITCLGKVIGGGLPVGAYGGKRKIMELVAPVGPMYQAGTLSGNPLAMSAGISTLTLLGQTGAFEQIAANRSRLVDGIRERAERFSVPMQVGGIGTMFGFFFLKEKAAEQTPITNYEIAKAVVDRDRYGKFFHQMLEAGIYFAPSQFEAAFMSLAHGESELEQTLEAFSQCLKF